MGIKLLSAWDRTRSSYWFLPTLMVLGAVLLSVLMIALDRGVEPAWVQNVTWLYLNEADGARALLAAVAGSMITVAGVTFSLTIVVLALTSGQYGPRLLRNFMRDAGNQVVLGTFLATFVYCMLILRTIRGGDTAFVPHFSIALAVVMALSSVGVFIYFIHHIAESIQGPTIIAKVSRDIHEIVLKKHPNRPLFPEALGHEPTEEQLEQALPPNFDESAVRVGSSFDGHVQAVDEAGLLKFAEEHRLVLKLIPCLGDYVMTGAPLVAVWPAERFDEAFAGDLREKVTLGAHRTQTQDVDFLFDQLAEAALRAVSPAINDPYTAMSCIDRLAEGLNLLTSRELPSPCRYDDAGNLRVVVPTVNIRGLVARTFGPIRRYGSDSLLLCLHMLETIEAALVLTQSAVLREALSAEAKLIYEGSCENFVEADYQRLSEAYQRTRRAGQTGSAKATAGFRRGMPVAESTSNR